MFSSMMKHVASYREAFLALNQEQLDNLFKAVESRLTKFKLRQDPNTGCVVNVILDEDLVDFVPGRMLGPIGNGASGDVLLMQGVIDPTSLTAVKKFEFPTLSLSKVHLTFFHEAKMLQSIEHESIVKIEDAMACPEYGFICLPFYERGSLRGHVEELTVPQIQHYFAQLCCGLRYLHRNGIVHRDVKLENILVRDDYNIVLTDFGLSERVDLNNELVTGRAGTVGYMAPEVATAGYEDVCNGFCADAYSVGIVIWCMLHKERVPMDTTVYTLEDPIVRDRMMSFAMAVLLPNDPCDRQDVISLLDKFVEEWELTDFCFDKSMLMM